MSARKAEEVVILGGGVLGFSTAYHLAKEGIASQIIEMDSIGAKASGNSCGMLDNAVGNFYYGGSSYTPGGAKPLFVPLGDESYRRFEQLKLELKELTGLDIQHDTGPSLRCALSEEEQKELTGIASEARSIGLNVTWVSGDEAKALENMLTDEVRGAVLGECGQVEAYRYTLALAQGAEKLGASIRYAQAVGFRCEKNRVRSVILSTGSEVRAGTIVIAMGPWSRQAAFWLGLQLPLNVLRGQTLKVVAPKCPKYQLSFVPPSETDWPHVYMLVSPRVDGTMILGYTEDRPETWDNSCPETWLDSPTPEMKHLILEQAVRFVPVLEEAHLVEHRAAVLGCPPSEGIIVGAVPKWENVYIAVMGDNGVELSPAVGRIMTDLIVGGDRARKVAEEVKRANPIKFMS